MKKRLSRSLSLALVMIMLVSSFSFAEMPDIKGDVKCYLIADSDSGEIIESYNIDQIVEIASITKLMTYMVAMDQVKAGNISLEDEIEMDFLSVDVGGSSFKTKIGAVYSLDEMLDLSLVASANNMTHKIARYISGTEEAFTVLMNQKAKEIGLETAIFYNSTGLPDRKTGDQNKMHTEDLLLFARYLLNNYPEVLDRTSKPSIVTKEGQEVKNTDPILGVVEGVDGLKTGFTNKAGYSILSTGARHIDGPYSDELRIIGIMMGSQSEKERARIIETMMEYALGTYKKQTFLNKDIPYKIEKTKKAIGGEVKIYPKESFYEIMTMDKELSLEEDLGKLRLPLKPGEKVGSVKILDGDEAVFETDLIVKQEIKRASMIKRLLSWIEKLKKTK